ncbi:MAG TPA: hypothetical protein VMF87_20105 [Streptosporangiaceae bacterium]|nr:hypothetical protein [Streptosporangiaceae bacterium]
MVYTLSYQMYKSERGLDAAEQRAADVRAGEAAAAVRDVRAGLGRVFRARALRGRALRGRPAGRAAGAVTGSGAASRLLSSGRQGR